MKAVCQMFVSSLESPSNALAQMKIMKAKLWYNVPTARHKPEATSVQLHQARCFTICFNAKSVATMNKTGARHVVTTIGAASEYDP